VGRGGTKGRRGWKVWGTEKGGRVADGEVEGAGSEIRRVVSIKRNPGEYKKGKPAKRGEEGKRITALTRKSISGSDTASSGRGSSKEE